MIQKSAEAYRRRRDGPRPALRYPLHLVGTSPLASEAKRQEVRRRLFGFETAASIEAKRPTEMAGDVAPAPDASIAPRPLARGGLDILDDHRPLKHADGIKLSRFGSKAKRWRDARLSRPEIRGTDSDRCRRHLAISEWYHREILAEEAEAERLEELEEAVDDVIAAEIKLRDDDWFAGRIKQIALDDARLAEAERSRLERVAALEARQAELERSRLERAKAARLRAEAKEAEEAKARVDAAGPLVGDLLTLAARCLDGSIDPDDAVAAWRDRTTSTYSKRWGPNAVVRDDREETRRRRARAFAEAHLLLEIGQLVSAGATCTSEERRWLRGLGSIYRLVLATDWIDGRCSAILSSGASPGWIASAARRIGSELWTRAAITRELDKLRKDKARCPREDPGIDACPTVDNREIRSRRPANASRIENERGVQARKTERTALREPRVLRSTKVSVRKKAEAPRAKSSRSSGIECKPSIPATPVDRSALDLKTRLSIRSWQAVDEQRSRWNTSNPMRTVFLAQVRSVLPAECIRWRGNGVKVLFSEVVASVMTGADRGARLLVFHQRFKGVAAIDVRCARRQLVQQWSGCIFAAASSSSSRRKLSPAVLDEVANLRTDLSVDTLVDCLHTMGLGLAVGPVEA